MIAESFVHAQSVSRRKWTRYSCIVNNFGQLYAEHFRRFVGTADVHQTIRRASLSELEDFAESLTASSSPDLLDNERSPYNQWSSSTLSGGTFPCASPRCRIGAANELGRYAALYADRVYIQNPFNRYHSAFGDDSEGLRSDFTHDVAVIQHLLPLIEAGCVVPVSLSLEHCMHRLPKGTYGAQASKHTAAALRQIESDIVDSLKCELVWDDNEVTLQISGDAETLAHSAILYKRFRVPRVYRSREMKARLRAGEALQLPAKSARAEVRRKVLRRHWQEVNYQIAAAQALGTSFVTDRRLHLRILSAVNSEMSVDSRNLIAERYLTALVPFVADVPIADLVLLRKREHDAFVTRCAESDDRHLSQ